ncbi:hypothetical protein C5E45_20625 [Nocardia nova]|uniref:Uncharacterized protein n=1 Tax=Nocardia nova TaxID=37330 RepID=A0A2S6AMK4_9NOCA|nr:hypothetical protein [Nocardia nova]PPJ36452.1 hypothetical protein C5E45_20625 [Nocardia nova]
MTESHPFTHGCSPAPADPDDASDAELARILAACQDWNHALTESESRALAAAFAQVDTPLQHWGAGVAVAYSERLIRDTDQLLYFASIEREPHDPHRYADGARNALYALRAYFENRALQPPNRADYLGELNELYAAEIEFLRTRGHTPAIDWIGDEPGRPALTAFLDNTHELYATNGDACLIGSHTEQPPARWSVAIRERDTGEIVASAAHTRFATAYDDALTSSPVTSCHVAAEDGCASENAGSRQKARVTLPKDSTVCIDDIVGLDAENCLIVRTGAGDSTIVLTPCCRASGKGSLHSATGVVCRSCYADVDHKHGDINIPIAIARDDLDIVIEP